MVACVLGMLSFGFLEMSQMRMQNLIVMHKLYAQGTASCKKLGSHPTPKLAGARRKNWNEPERDSLLVETTPDFGPQTRKKKQLGYFYQIGLHVSGPLHLSHMPSLVHLAKGC